MAKKKTHDEFLQDVLNLVDDEYTILSTYKNSKEHIKMKHNLCEHEWGISPSKFLTGRRCPKCSNRIKITHEDFERKLNVIAKDEYKLLTKCKSSTSPVIMKHNLCGHEWTTSHHSFVNGKHRCPKCSTSMEKSNIREYKEKIYKKWNDEYTVLDDIYKNARTGIRTKHNRCGHIYNAIPFSLLRGHGCGVCANNILKTNERFSKELLELYDGEYKLVGEYTGDAKKVEVKHRNCEIIFNATPSSILQGSGCPNCASSKGEVRIGKWLSDKEIKFRAQETFSDCKNINLLRFDFSALDVNGKLILIEYDGRQHFEPVSHFGGDKGFKDTKIRDDIKNRYCENKKIKLVRIPHWEFDNIESILSKEFFK